MSESISNADHPSILSMPRSMAIDDRDLEDGPLFRATVTQLEGKTSALKASVKRILKAATASLEAKRALAEADEEFVRVLKDIPSVDPLFTSYLDATWPKMHEQWERMQHSMQSLLIDPLQKLYEMDIKAAETKRRQFDDESKQYYAYLAKYLSLKKDTKKDNEAKHLGKKHHFDIIKFEYLAFLNDLHGGKKNQEILYHLLSYQQKQHAFYQSVAAILEPSKQGLDDLASMLADVSREQNIVNKERNEKRKLLELQQQRSSLDEQHPSSSSPPAIVEHQPVEQPAIVIDEDKFRGIRDLQQQPDRDLVSGCGRRKEGFLFSTSKPLKNNNTFDKASGAIWHKYWCVLSGGQLHEYSNWKGQLQTHIEPINLRFATAREARNTERRFCFEVITTHFRRVYQATSQEEMQSWVATINNAIESLLNGMGSSVDLLKDMDQQSKPQKKKHGRSLSGALRLGLTGAGTGSGNSNPATVATGYLKKRASNLSGIDGADLLAAVAASNGRPSESEQNKFRWSGLSFGRSSSTSHRSSYKFEPTVANTQLLSQLRLDPSNTHCADCGEENPDWCSLNLGIALCIECSGIHRSLGTHISKVRSLTLDSTSYTPDIVALLRSMGNARSNAIWTAKATPDDIPKPDDNRQVKLKYIQTKYVDRAFVAPLAGDLQTLLFNAIDTDDIPAAMHAIALGAHVNACRVDPPQRIPLLSDDEDDDDEWQRRIRSNSSNLDDFIIRYPLHYALLHGRASVDEDVDREHVFPMAELLLQNGADTGLVDSETGCTLSELVGIGHVIDDEAITYLNSKNSARGQSPILRASLPPPTLLHDDCESHSSCTLNNDTTLN